MEILLSRVGNPNLGKEGRWEGKLREEALGYIPAGAARACHEHLSRLHRLVHAATVHSRNVPGIREIADAHYTGPGHNHTALSKVAHNHHASPPLAHVSPLRSFCMALVEPLCGPGARICPFSEIRG